MRTARLLLVAVSLSLVALACGSGSGERTPVGDAAEQTTSTPPTGGIEVTIPEPATYREYMAQLENLASQIVDPPPSTFFDVLHALGHELDDPYDRSTMFPEGICDVAATAGGWFVHGEPQVAAEVATTLQNAGLTVAGSGPCETAVEL